MGSGLFIVFEGLDGSGKSTQITMLAARMRAQGRQVRCTAEPTSMPTGKLLRKALGGSGDVGAAQMAGLFLADRIAHNVDAEEGFQSLLDAGIDVISDRYYYSSFAYQGMDTDLQWVMDMHLNCPAIRKPDLCIFLDVDDATCKARIDSTRAHLETFERDVRTLHAVRDKFFEVFRLLEGKENIRIVNANRSVEEIAEDVFRLAEELEAEKKA